MNYGLRYSPSALKDMESVWDGVKNVSASHDIANRYVSEFMAKIAMKKDFPKSGISLYYRGLFTGFYSVNFKAYKAFYRINDGHIEVVRILLAKMDYMKILFGEPEE